MISSHPGCTLDDAINLALYLKSIGYMPEQVQDFYPTPSTKSTCMYYTEINPDTMEPIYVPKSRKEKMFQRALMQYRKKSNYDLVHDALVEAGREDLIGFDAECLIKPTHEEAIERKKREEQLRPHTRVSYQDKADQIENKVKARDCHNGYMTKSRTPKRRGEASSDVIVNLGRKKRK